MRIEEGLDLSFDEREVLARIAREEVDDLEKRFGQDKERPSVIDEAIERDRRVEEELTRGH